MRKKVLVAVLSVTLLISGCVSANANAGNDEVQAPLVLVESTPTYNIYVDKDTGVMYLWVMTMYKGGLTVMLNADGTPKIWQQEESAK